MVIVSKQTKEVHTMKFKEMDKRQQTATLRVWETCGFIVGGLENTLMDYEPDTEEYKEAEATLKDHSVLTDMVYTEVMWDTEKSILKHIKFCGKDFIMERIDKRLKKLGH